MNNKKRELFFFIASGVLHAAFIYWLLNASINVKVFVPQEEIAEVVIVSSGKLRSPILLESQSPKAENQTIPGPKRQLKGPQQEARRQPNPTTSPPGHHRTFSSDPLNLQVITRREEPFEVNLDLSLNSRLDASDDYKKILKNLETEGGSPIYNLSRHVATGGLPGGPEDLAHQASSGNSKGFFNIKNFDIKPWAQRVVSRVNHQWSIPLAIKVGATGIVGVQTVFKKNGDIASVAVTQASGLETLDQAALAAVKNSAPFPSLPGDFPNETLEVYFVFEYGT